MPFGRHRRGMLPSRVRTLLSIVAAATLAPSALGAEEPHSSHLFAGQPERDLVRATVEVRVEPVTLEGLKFFAIQVGFSNDVSAHGGAMVSSSEKKANWGALSSNSNYAINDQTPESVRLEVLELMQNAPDRTVPLDWQPNVWYVLDVSRGPTETLPAGSYSVLNEPKVLVDHDRYMRAWRFQITRADDGQTILDKTLHVHAEFMTGFMYWTETGYGVTCDEKIRVHWRSPRFVSEKSGERTPTTIKKGLKQSTCPLEKTTDFQRESPELLGALQTYGEPRAPDSFHGQLLYDSSEPDAGAASADPISDSEPQPGTTEESEAPSAGGCRISQVRSLAGPETWLGLAGLLALGLRRRARPSGPARG